MEPKTVERITFLVHPYCYAESLRARYAENFPYWEEYHRYELGVAERWHRAIDGMGERDVVVYHPCYESTEEKDLAERCRRRLGDRFFTQAFRASLYTAEILGAIAPDIENAFKIRGKYRWHAHDLRVAAFSWAYSHDVLAAFHERRIAFDPSSVRLRAMGESFEGCANNWSTMLPPYLGVPARMEMPFELSVPDTRFLLACRYVKRVELPFDTALHLLVEPPNNPVAFWVRERVSLQDVSYCATFGIPPERLSVRIRDGSVVFAEGKRCSEKVPPSVIQPDSGAATRIMVASGRWRGGDAPPYQGRESHLFVSAAGMDPQEFFALAEAASIAPEP